MEVDMEVVEKRLAECGRRRICGDEFVERGEQLNLRDGYGIISTFSTAPNVGKLDFTE